MIYHGRVTGPAGQVYQCEHNHRTETAAITCANSSGTHRMAEIVWNRAAVQAAQAAALAKKRNEERAAAQARRIAAQEASKARQAAAHAGAQEAKAAKRAAKLAAMKPQRAWKRMTPAERLLRTADAEMEAYGEIRSRDAQAAYEERAARSTARNVPAPSKSLPPPIPLPPMTHAAVAKPIPNGSGAMAAIGALSGLCGIAGGVAAAVVHASAHAPVCAVTAPMSCFQAQVNASSAGIPELAIAVLLLILAAILTFAAKDAARKRAINE
jgi:hypothetical protein